MKRSNPFLWQLAPLRAFLESWGLGCILLIPMLPTLLEAPPLPFSLYLVQLPLLCSITAGLRLRFFYDSPFRTIVKEIAFGLVLGLGIFGMVVGTFQALGQMDAIRFSYSRTGGTFFFLWMVVPEYLAVRMASWAWGHWYNLRSRRFALALTHVIMMVVGGIILLFLVGLVIATARLLGNDIWGIPPGDTFAQIVFWLTIIILFSSLLFMGGIFLFLPPTTLFSFLVARKMTVRLEKLAHATRALRQGNLSNRIDLEGEDEIAQLQADFNAMATDLEASMLAFKNEKDKVLALSEARRELVAGISHELRNPAATIQGYIESLQRNWNERPPQDVGRDLETIQYETIRLKAILDDLLIASQIDADRLEIKLQEVNINTLAKRLVETFAGLAWQRKRVQITLNAPDNNVFGFADPLRLEQVLVNLVQNALQHTAPGGLVALDIHPDSRIVDIEVEDTGEGISPADLPHIWEKYHHADNAHGSSHYGMGLGLSLVKELTEAMGGSVMVESSPGQGSLFRVTLPASKRFDTPEDSRH